MGRNRYKPIACQNPGCTGTVFHVLSASLSLKGSLAVLADKSTRYGVDL